MALGERAATAWNVIRLVGVELVRPLAPLSNGRPDGRDGVKHRLEDHRVVPICASQERGEQKPTPARHKVPLGAGFPTIRGVGSDDRAPLFAGIDAESRQARLQSTGLASPRRSSSVWCNASQTPAACYSRNRRQQVMPEPQPLSCGSSCRWRPVFSTTMMPVKQARSGTRDRPPLDLGGSAGSSGATRAQNSSSTSDLAIPSVCHSPPVLIGALNP